MKVSSKQPKVTAALESGRLLFNVPYRFKDVIRNLPGAKWTRRDRLWTAPLTWNTLVQARSLFGSALAVSNSVREWAWAEYSERVAPTEQAREAALDPKADADADADPRLRKYQRTAIKFLEAARSAILADDMGLGKTFTVLATLHNLNAWPALIVASKSVKANWAIEAEHWYPELRVQLVDSTGSKRERQLEADADLFIVNYETLLTGRVAPYGSIHLTEKDKRDGPLNRPWGAVVADEAHRIKDPHAKATRALWAVGSEARYRFALTGTPIANNPGDLWSLLHFISPEEWPGKTAFIDRYLNVFTDWFGHMEIGDLKTDTEAEFHSLVNLRLLRRTKELLAPELPPKVYEVRNVPMSPKQATAYKAMKKNQVVQLDSGTLAAFNPLSVLARLSQFASAYCEIDENNNVHMALPSNKVDAVVELAEEVTPLVVFAVNRDLIDLTQRALISKGYKVGRITGEENEYQRKEALEQFQNGRLDVMLCTLGAGSEGINLTKASTLVYMQRDYSSIHAKQSEDRLHRIGQTAERVTIIDLIAEGTVESNIGPSLANKASLMEQVVQDRDALRRLIEE